MTERLRLAINDVLTGNHGGIPAKVVAKRMGIPEQTLYSYGQTGPKGRNIPVDKLLALVAAAEDPRPIGALCQEAGGAFLPVPRTSGPVNPAVIKSVKEFGEAVTAVGAALEDGSLTGEELTGIDREIGEAMQGLASLRAALHAQALKKGRP